MPDITVVSGTYNRLNELKGMLASARAHIPQGITLDFVLVDGGSTDGTIEYLKTVDDVTLIEQGELLGAINAFCAGTDAATGDYVVMANDDIEFVDDSIFRAFCHLETHPACGGVAFADNRYAPGKTGHRVMGMQARDSAGRPIHVNYAQVGMFPKWLGDLALWWGRDDETFTARTYGADNYLSAKIWEMGYTIDAVDGVKINDFVTEDELRALNGQPETGNHPDSDAYYKRFPNGPKLPGRQMVERPNDKHLRTLYLPIYENRPDDDPIRIAQTTQKRGLREALKGYGYVWEIDYLRLGDLKTSLVEAVKLFRPNLIVSQFHGAVLTYDEIRNIRATVPNAVWVNWNGDVWEHGLTSKDVINMARAFDVQGVVNASVLPTYKAHGVNAMYWQIGYEEAQKSSKNVEARDVIWLANNYSDARRAFCDKLGIICDKLGICLDVWGENWDNNGKVCLYDFNMEHALYSGAKFIIGDNQYPDRYGYFSNRVFQSLYVGGGLLLHQTVPGLEELTGLIDGVHYVAWNDTDELEAKIAYYLEHEDERRKIVETGAQFVCDFHSFDMRLRELFQFLLEHNVQPSPYIALQYVGKRAKPFGIKAEKGRTYSVTPGEIVYVHPDDMRYFGDTSLFKRLSVQRVNG